MSHLSQMKFFELVSGQNAELVDGASVVEIGSYDVNGSVRALFGGAGRYLGVDLVAGPGVDLVSYGHEIDAPAGSFDVALSSECFEHDENWPETLAHMANLTRPGGLVAFTCASWARPEHGTRRTTAVHSPGTQSVGSDYYRNLTQSDVEGAVDIASLFSSWVFAYEKDHFDLYFAGVRAGTPAPHAPVAKLPTDEDIATCRGSGSVKERARGAALRTLRRASSEETYQDLLLRFRHLRQGLRAKSDQPS